MIKLSLCMTVKDVAQSLGRCLASAYSLVDEIIIIDNGSTDDTLAVAQEWGAKVLSHQATMDLGLNRNLALDLAQGEWILCLEANEELVASAKDIAQLMKAHQVEGYSFELVDWVREDPGHTVLTSAPSVRLFKKKPEYKFDATVCEGMKHTISNQVGLQGVAPSNLTIIRYPYSPSQPWLVVGPSASQAPYQQWQLGLQYLQNREFALALQCLREAQNIVKAADLPEPTIEFHLVLCMIKLGRWREAEALLNEKVDERYQATKLLLKGYLAQEAKDWESAVKWLTYGIQLLRQRPELAQETSLYWFYYFLGEAQVGLNRSWGALVSFGLALEKQPLFIAALVAITGILPKLTEVPENIFGRVISFTDPVVQISLSKRLFNAGEQPAAILASLGAVYQLAGGYGGKQHKCRGLWPHACAMLLSSLGEHDDQVSELLNRAQKLELKTAGSLISGLPESLLPQLPWLDQWRKDLIHSVTQEIQQKFKNDTA